MCGIAGYFNKNSNFENINLTIDKMNDLQLHRGPNSTGKFVNFEKNFICKKLLKLHGKTDPY